MLPAFLVVVSCEKEAKEDVVNQVNKNRAIETVVSVEHIGDHDLLITKHKIWKNNQLFKEIIKKDTIPSLGDTLTTRNDANGNEVTGTVKKDYEFYITVQ